MPNHDFRILQPNKYLRPIGFVFLGALCSFQVNAKSGTPDFRVLNPNSLTDSQRANYLALRDSWVSGATVNGQPAQIIAGSSSVGTTSGRLTLSTQGSLKVGTATVPVVSTIKGTLAATGKLAIALAKVAGPVGVAVAAYDLFSAIKGFSVSYNPVSKDLDVTKINQGVECTGGSFAYRDSCALVFQPYLGGFGPKATQRNGQNSFVVFSNDDVRGVTTSCSTNDGHCWDVPYNMRPDLKVLTGTTEPATLQDLENAIASESGWPSGLVENMAQKAIESGLVPEVDPSTKTVTGPSTSGVPKVTTKNNPDGSTEKTTETTNITYQGNSIKIDNSSVVTNYNPVTNNTTTTTQTTENPDLPKDDPKTDCEKNPKAIGCQEIDFDTPTGDIPKSTRSITFQADDLGFGGGTCPADVMLTPHGMSQIKAFDWVSACDTITTYVKPMMLALAGFAALMIIFVGGRTE